MGKKLNNYCNYQSSSEYVSIGHPDRVCDVAASIIIDDIQFADGPNSHAAVEVFLTHDTIIYSGEVKTTLKIDDKYLHDVTQSAFKACGYIPEMRKFWTVDEVILADDLKIINKVHQQSPDIALATTDKDDKSGYNDQGIYFSCAENTNPKRIGSPMNAAKKISDFLHNLSFYSITSGGIEYGPENSKIVLGPDNKCVITMEVKEDGFTPVCITGITIAVAHSSQTPVDLVRKYIKEYVCDILTCDIPISDDCTWTINGTGRFVIHGCLSDTSMTGRKISVNHPSAGPFWMNKMIGGGSLVKPWHASDLILNLAARFISSIVVMSGYSKYATVGCSCGIGQTSLQSFFIYGDPEFEKNTDLKTRITQFFREEFPWSPYALAKTLGLFNNDFSFRYAVINNFFGDPMTQPWEHDENLGIWIEKLKIYVNEVQG